MFTVMSEITTDCQIINVSHMWENVRMPGVEPGSQAWEACMMPLHYMRLETEAKSLFDGAKQKKRFTKLGDVHGNLGDTSRKSTRAANS